PISDAPLADDVKVDLLFDDRLVIAAGANSRWARRRKIDLAELIDEPWILPPTDTWHHECLVEAFSVRGLSLPKARLVSFCVPLRTHLLAAGPYLTLFAHSVMRHNAQRFQITVLPVELPVRSWPAVVITLQHRTLSPVVERFIACAREVAKEFVVPS